MSAALGLSCYRVIEESLTNVTRHSTATHIAVSVAHEASGLALSVEDPGPARRQPDGPDRDVGRGLLGMKQRVDIFGGTLTAGHSEAVPRSLRFRGRTRHDSSALADDQPLMLSALRSILEAHGIEVSATTNGDDAVPAKDLSTGTRPDIRMPGRNGIDATAEPSATAPSDECSCSPRSATTSICTARWRRRGRLHGEELDSRGAGDRVRAIAGGDSVLDPAPSVCCPPRRPTQPAVPDRSTSSMNAKDARLITRLEQSGDRSLPRYRSDATHVAVPRSSTCGIGFKRSSTATNRVSSP